MSENTAVATVAETVNSLNEGTIAVYTSFKGESFESKVATLEATTNAEKINEHLGETIVLKNVVVQAITVVDEETGEENDAARVILIDQDGNSYAAVSGGILKALTNIFAIVGEPHTWPEGGIAIKVVEERSRRGFRFMTIKLVEHPAKAATAKK